MQFKIIEVTSKIDDENKGTKAKYWATVDSRNALVKLNKYLPENPNKDVRSWNVSEKIYSELSKHLRFNCVETDFIINENNKYGIASYDYKNDDMQTIISGDDLFFSVFKRKSEKKGKNKDKISKDDYSYANILTILLHYDEAGSLVKEFNKIMLMDALTGEMDRHFENWGLYKHNNNCYGLLPAYDNSSCLLHIFRDEQILNKTMGQESLEEYSKKSVCKISIDGIFYSHFDFIDYLVENLPEEFKQDLIMNIKKLNLLSDDFITELVSKIPNAFCTDNHKELIIKYLIIRRNILLSKVV